DSLIQHAGEPVNDGAFNVALSCFWLNDGATIDRCPDLVHADFAAATIEGDFNNTRAKRARPFGNRQSQSASLWARRFPVGHLRHGFKDLASFRARAHAREAKLDRIDTLVPSHLIDKTLYGKDVEDVSDRSPEIQIDAVRYWTAFDVLVRHSVVRNLDARQQQNAAIADHTMPPTGDLAGVVQRCFEALE